MGSMLTVEHLPLSGAAEIHCSPIKDERGWFARYFCQETLSEINHGRPIQQVNSSFTKQRGTIRGLHFQNPPFAEDKIVRCILGSVYDVMLDLRWNSPTLGRWHGVVLDAEKMNMVYIPRGFAHGLQTLEDDCQVLYLHTEFHAPHSERGFRYDSPFLNIPWPLDVTHLSDRDKTLPLFESSFEGIKI